MPRLRICMRAECRDNRHVRIDLARAEGRIDALDHALSTVVAASKSAADEARALRRRVSVLEASLRLALRILNSEERALIESAAGEVA
jgi:hypothetical protein